MNHFLVRLYHQYLSFKVKNKLALSKKERRYLLYDFYSNLDFIWFLPKQGLSYIAVEKVGITSIKSAILGNNAKNIHSEFARIAENRVDNADDYFVFGFVRNPFSRLVSCYKEKVVKNNPIYKRYLGGFLTDSDRFADFVRRISIIPRNLQDKHFKGQYAIIYEREIGGGKNRAKLYW